MSSISASSDVGWPNAAVALSLRHSVPISTPHFVSCFALFEIRSGEAAPSPVLDLRAVPQAVVCGRTHLVAVTVAVAVTARR